MRILLFVLAMLSFLAGFIFIAITKSAATQIEGFILLATSAILFAGAGIIEVLNLIRVELKAND